MLRADNLNTFVYLGILGASISWIPKGLSMPVMGQLYVELSVRVHVATAGSNKRL